MKRMSSLSMLCVDVNMALLIDKDQDRAEALACKIGKILASSDADYIENNVAWLDNVQDITE